MGLASMPSASEGMLCLILMNTAMSISIVKGIFRSILKVVGFQLADSSSPPYSYFASPQVVSTEPYDVNLSPPLSYVEEFRNQNPAIKYETLLHCEDAEHDCSVCLTEFEPQSDINNLSCGHLFHKVCLEKWLDYLNVTCPLCRTPLIPEFEDDPSCFWWECFMSLSSWGDFYVQHVVYRCLLMHRPECSVVYTPSMCELNLESFWRLVEKTKILL